MKVREIQVHAGRTFNHPFESYSNLRPEVTMTAVLEKGDDPKEAVRNLQAQAEELVENHKRHLLESIEQLQELSEADSRIRGLENQIHRAQEGLEEVRRKRQEMQAAPDALPVGPRA